MCIVVIAIIGMLSSVVLGSLNTARGKAANSAVKSNLNNIRAQAELYYDGNNNTYTNLCLNSANMINGLNAASTAGAGNITSDVCNANANAWAGSAPLKVAEGTSNYWCVDSTGTSRGHVSALGSATACP
jgi:type II secretory pathway pseudopilin PulG